MPRRLQEIALLSAIAGAAVFAIGSERERTYTAEVVLAPVGEVSEDVAEEFAAVIDSDALIDEVTERRSADRSRVEALVGSEGAEPGTLLLTLTDGIDDTDGASRILKTGQVVAEELLEAELAEVAVNAPIEQSSARFAVVPAIVAAALAALVASVGLYIFDRQRRDASEALDVVPPADADAAPTPATGAVPGREAPLPPFRPTTSGGPPARTTAAPAAPRSSQGPGVGRSRHAGPHGPSGLPVRTPGRSVAPMRSTPPTRIQHPDGPTRRPLVDLTDSTRTPPALRSTTDHFNAPLAIDLDEPTGRPAGDDLEEAIRRSRERLASAPGGQGD